VVASIFFLGVAAFGQTSQDTSGSRPNPYARVWKFAEWYKNDANPTIQNVLFTGRFQYEYVTADADQGKHHEWNIRRFRAGIKAKLFRQLTLHSEAEINPQERDPFYVRLTDAYAEWSKSESLALTFGKQGVPFTMEGATSSKELLTIDRSNLANNIWFPQEYMPGVSASGEVSGWLYHAGVYSAGEANRELGEFNGSVFTLISIGRDLGERLGANEAILTGSYVFQNPDARNTFARQLQHVGSINLSFEKDRWGFRSDVAAASGYLGQGDMRGFMILPYFDITPQLQVVARETFIDGDTNSVRLASYESRVVPGRGDRFNEVYLGANYYFHGHKLKLQSGLQFADMNDRAGDGGNYSGYAWTTGLRVSW
jgi:phosphate-selective porin OprO/OprP